MDFWGRVKAEIATQCTTQEWVAHKAGVSFRTFAGWILKNRLPRADEAVAIAGALGRSVEYLVIGKDSAGWRPGPRIAPIVDDLVLLTDDELGLVGVMVHPLAEAHRSQAASGGG